MPLQGVLIVSLTFFRFITHLFVLKIALWHFVLLETHNDSCQKKTYKNRVKEKR